MLNSTKPKLLSSLMDLGQPHKLKSLLSICLWSLPLYPQMLLLNIWYHFLPTGPPNTSSRKQANTCHIPGLDRLYVSPTMHILHQHWHWVWFQLPFSSTGLLSTLHVIELVSACPECCQEGFSWGLSKCHQKGVLLGEMGGWTAYELVSVSPKQLSHHVPNLPCGWTLWLGMMSGTWLHMGPGTGWPGLQCWGREVSCTRAGKWSWGLASRHTREEV